MQTLQAALKQGWSDETVAQRLVNKITCHTAFEPQPMDKTPVPLTYPKDQKHALGKQALGDLLHPKVSRSRLGLLQKSLECSASGPS